MDVSGANHNSIRQWWYWLTLVPILVGASLALLKYAGWSAVYSAYYGLPSEAWRLKEASPKAQLYGCPLLALGLTATILATALISPFRSETRPAGLRALIRVGLAIALVTVSILVLAYGLSTAGHFLRFQSVRPGVPQLADGEYSGTVTEYFNI